MFKRYFALSISNVGLPRRILSTTSNLDTYIEMLLEYSSVLVIEDKILKATPERKRMSWRLSWRHDALPQGFSLAYTTCGELLA